MRAGSGIQWQFTLAFLAAATSTLLVAASGILAFATLFPVEPSLVESVWALLPTDTSVPQLVPFLVLTTITVVAIGGVCSIFGYIAARDVNYRLRILKRAAISIGLGDLRYRVPPMGEDEFGDLAGYVNSMAEQLEANARDLRRLAAMEERNRLAGDLHDSVNQQIFTINLLAATARRLIHKNPEKAVEQMQQLESLARAAHSEMRTLIHALRPGTLEQNGLGGALTEQLNTVTARSGVTVRAELAGAEGLRLPAEQELALLRIAQEALGNAVKHSGAAEVRLALSCCDGTLCLTIVDNGNGFDPNRVQQGGLGLQTMRERATTVGADFDLTSTPGTGTTVAVRLPLASSPPDAHGTAPFHPPTAPT